MKVLLKKHLECDECELRSGCTQVVIPDNPKPLYGLFAVGEAPGADEDKQGVGFAGRAGQTLDTLLLNAHPKIRLKREEWGRANIVCCRPPDNRPPKKREVSACSPWLEQHMTKTFDVDVIFAVGKTPSEFFYDGKGLWEIIQKAKKQQYVPDLYWAREAGIKVVPSPHTSPLAFNRNCPTGEKWKDIAYRQAKIAIDLVM